MRGIDKIVGKDHLIDLFKEKRSKLISIFFILLHYSLYKNIKSGWILFYKKSTFYETLNTKMF